MFNWTKKEQQNSAVDENLYRLIALESTVGDLKVSTKKTEECSECGVAVAKDKIEHVLIEEVFPTPYPSGDTRHVEKKLYCKHCRPKYDILRYTFDTMSNSPKEEKILLKEVVIQ